MIGRGRERFRIAWSEKRPEMLAKRRRCCYGGAFRLPFKRFSRPTSTTERQSRMVLMGRMFSHFMRMASSSLLSELFIRKPLELDSFFSSISNFRLYTSRYCWPVRHISERWIRLYEHFIFRIFRMMHYTSTLLLQLAL